MGRFMRGFLCVWSFLCLCPLPAMAGELLQWSAHNVQLLRGYDYKLSAEEQQTIVTLEHASGWSFGDLFAFTDLTYPDGGDSDYYLEISPRLSLGKITGADLSFGPIKDVLISTTLEKGRELKPRYLYGGAVDLDLPGFRFFSANAYVRDDVALDGRTWQVTLAWQRPFTVGGVNFMAEGFSDFSGHEDTSHPNQLIVPRLLVDVGDLSGWKSDTLWAGIEYQYWHNKYGVNGVTESVSQMQVKLNL